MDTRGVFFLLLCYIKAEVLCPPKFSIVDDLCYLDSQNFSTNGCPFFDDAPLWKYGPYIGKRKEYFILNAIFDEDIGYLVYKEPDLFYNSIISHTEEHPLRSIYKTVPIFRNKLLDDCECLAYSTKKKISVTGPCSSYKRYCYWLNIKNNNTVCSIYRRICESFFDATDASDCHCVSNYTQKHFCREYCPTINEPEKIRNCKLCDEAFEKYGEPKLNVYVENGRVFVSVVAPLKLKIFDGYPFKCFNGQLGEYLIKDIVSYNSNLDLLRLQYKLLKSKILTYEYIPDQPEYAATFWCVGFSYPYMEIIESNKVYISKGIDYVIVVNVSLSNANVFKLPYEYMFDVFLDVTESAEVAEIRNTVNYTVHIVGYGNNSTWNFEQAVEVVTKQLYQCNVEIPFFSEIRNGQYCSATVEYNLTWPKAYPRQKVPSEELCVTTNDEVITRTCLGDVLYGFYWSELSGVCFKSMESKYSKHLNGILNNPCENCIKEEVQTFLRNKDLELEPQDVYLISKVIGKLSEDIKSHNDLSDFINIVSTVMNIDENILESAQNQLNSTDTILSSIDEGIGNFLKHQEVEVHQVYSKNLNIHINKLHSVDEVVITLKSDGQFKMNGEMDFSTTDFATSLSKDLVETITEKNGTYLVAAVFQKDSLFRSPEPKRISGVIGNVYVQGVESKYLENPLKIYTRPSRTYRSEHKCIYWKYGTLSNLETVQGSWIIEKSATNLDGLYYCEYNHMTHFGILVDIPPDAGLDIVSLVGSSISFMSSIIVFITALLNREWRSSDGAKISLNIALTNILMIIFLYLADFVDSYKQEILCVMVGVSLQYILLSQICWNLVLGILQYRRFVIVFTARQSYTVLISCALSWLLPLIPVILTVSFQYDTYLKDQYCYLTGLGLYFGVLLPTGVGISFNALIFFRIFLELFLRRKIASKTSKELKVYVKLAVFLFFIMGFTWIFGILRGFIKTPILAYLFCICASLKGFVTLLVHVGMNADARVIWSKIFCRNSKK